MSAARRSPVPERPEGLLYREDFLGADEERDALAFCEGIELVEVRMHGRPARRTVRHYGYGYDFDARQVNETEPLPGELEWLRERAASLAELPPERLAEALVTRYPPGATIGWHRDAPMFGAKVVGVSLLSACRMRFRREVGGEPRAFHLTLAPRSAYVLAGAARAAWQHSIPPVPSLRYSITFRTLRR